MTARRASLVSAVALTVGRDDAFVHDFLSLISACFCTPFVVFEFVCAYVSLDIRFIRAVARVKSQL